MEAQNGEQVKRSRNGAFLQSDVRTLESGYVGTLKLHVPFCCSSLFLPCLAYSLYDTHAYIRDLFARVVWEMEGKK